MRHGRFLFVVPFGLAFVLSVGLDVGKAADDELEQTDEAVATSDEPRSPAVPFTLLPVPKITRIEAKKATEAEAREIQALIESLKQIKEPDLGLGYSRMPGASAVDFAPISGEACKSFNDLMTRGLKPNPLIKKLVEFGPRAIPFLLEALDDASPTLLSFGRTETNLVNELPSNPFNNLEATALKQLGTRKESEPSGVGYTVRVGDICLVVLGQIANRPYAVFTFQGLNCSVNSPVEDTTLAKSVRDIWGDSDHAQKLFDSLLIDFQTRGVWSDGVEGPWTSNSFQNGAAMRLAYYFPDDATTLIADRLNGLDVTTEDMEQRWASNGVDAAGFVHAVSWSSDHSVATEVSAIFEKTPDEAITLACCPGIDKQHDDTVFQRLVGFLRKQVLLDGYDLGHPQCLLMIGERFPDRATDVYRKYVEIERFPVRDGKYVEINHVERRRELCFVLRQTCGRFSIDLLADLLEDKTKTGVSFWVAKDKTKPNDGILINCRICDFAAETISMNFPDLTFEMRYDLDRQIDKMKLKIADMKKGEK